MVDAYKTRQAGPADEQTQAPGQEAQMAADREQQGAAGEAVVIRLQGASRVYRFYASELDRIKEVFTGKPRYQENIALHPLDLTVRRGEVLGVIGKNGAGKSTLLKLLANTAQPSSGSVEVQGRVAALLELGASFHPEMSGHENIFLNCAILGLDRAQTEAIYDSIIEFSGIGDFIQRPVKTYSSGMFVRLAFSIAAHIDPEILIIDEALSVGDGAFARKSFDRIMQFKRAGKTILFCTHSLYQIEAICDRVLWLDEGRVMGLGSPAEVVTDYGEFLRNDSPRREVIGEDDDLQAASLNPGSEQPAADLARLSTSALHGEASSLPGSQAGGTAGAVSGFDETPRVIDVRCRADQQSGRALLLHSGRSDLQVEVLFTVPAHLPMASVGIAISGGDGRILSSIGTVNDGVEIARNAAGHGQVQVVFPRFPMLKGKYSLDVYLMCERGLHIYEAVMMAAELNVRQDSLARGLVELPHQWLDGLSAHPDTQADTQAPAPPSVTGQKDDNPVAENEAEQAAEAALPEGPDVKGSINRQ